MKVVLDASVAVDWCLDSEQSADARKVLVHVLDEGAVVPSHWAAEVGNAFVSAMRSERMSAADLARAFDLLTDLRIDVAHEHDGVVREIERRVELARAHDLTTYDSAYLDLALRRALPLATLDRALRKAARSAGVKLFVA